MNRLVVDELTFGVAYRVWCMRPKRDILLLDPPRRMAKLWLRSLRLFGVSVVTAEFIAGHLRAEHDEPVPLHVLKEAGRLALAYSTHLLTEDPHLAELNTTFNRDTIRNSLVKSLWPYMRYWLSRIAVAQALTPDGCPDVLLRYPECVDPSWLSQEVRGVRLSFYGKKPLWRLRLLAQGVKEVVKESCLHFRKTAIPNKLGSLPGVLSVQEESLGVEMGLRRQPHWLGAIEGNSPYAIVILADRKTARGVDIQDLADRGIVILDPTFFPIALQKRGQSVGVRFLRKSWKRMLLLAFQAENYKQGFFRLTTAILLRQAECLAALCLVADIRLFLCRETHMPLTVAMQLAASAAGVKTVAYQYSNLGIPSPLMFSTADRFLLFSDMFRKVCQGDGIGPLAFEKVGYVYDHIFHVLARKARIHRQSLVERGADFVLCYFDENVAKDRWGLISREEHGEEIRTIARAVLEDRTLAVITKSKFIRNTPTRLFPDDALLQEAAATGRFVELHEGSHRNDILPAEAALAADMCLGHKFGATATLESALAGCRAIMLNPHRYQTYWDSLYERVNVVYSHMESALAAVQAFRSGDEDQSNLGDWTPILDHFDSFRDGRAAYRLHRRIIELLEENHQGAFPGKEADWSILGSGQDKSDAEAARAE